MYSDGTPIVTAGRRRDKAKDALLYFTSLLSLALLAAVIWLGVENGHRKNDINQLKHYLNGPTLTGATTESQAVRSTLRQI